MNVQERTAKKDYIEDGILTGQTYFWWRERGTIRRSVVRPIILRQKHRHFVEDVRLHYQEGRLTFEEVRDYLASLESQILSALSKYRSRTIPQRSILILQPKLQALQAVLDELQTLDIDDESSRDHLIDMLETLVDDL